jgi:hypothetical protein
MSALIRIAALLVPLVLVSGCARGTTGPVVVRVGVHSVSFDVPRGWQHYDHGREQRLESTDGDIVISDLGPVATAGFRRVTVEARELYRRGQSEDGKEKLRGLGVSRIVLEPDRRSLTAGVDEVLRARSDHEIELAFESLLARISRLSPPNLEQLARNRLGAFGHGPRRDLKVEEKLRVDGREARRIVTWQRLTHDHRRHHVFIVDRGNLLVLRTDVGVDHVLEPVFDSVVRSLRFVADRELTRTH